MSRVQGATALVTGGASGIGYMIARDLLAGGAARVVIWDRDESALQGAVAALSDALGSSASPRTGPGGEVEGRALDVTDTDAVFEGVRDFAARSVDVDILVNNAGIVVGRAFVDHTHADVERTMAVNALAPMHLTLAILPGMTARGRGHVVNIASAAGLLANPGMAAYCASKFAMVGWSDSLRLEMEQAGTGVRVTTVTPSYIDTGMFAGVRSRVIPMLEPERVARDVVDAIRRDRAVLRMPWIVNALPVVKGVLPRRLFELVVGRWFGVYGSMRTFRGRAEGPDEPDTRGSSEPTGPEG